MYSIQHCVYFKMLFIIRADVHDDVITSSSDIFIETVLLFLELVYDRTFYLKCKLCLRPHDIFLRNILLSNYLHVNEYSTPKSGFEIGTANTEPR